MTRGQMTVKYPHTMRFCIFSKAKLLSAWTKYQGSSHRVDTQSTATSLTGKRLQPNLPCTEAPHGIAVFSDTREKAEGEALQRPDEAIEMSYEQNGKPWSGMYMQQSTYRHDFVPTNGISPRNRQTNYPYGADAPKADIPGPYNNFRPRYGDPLPQHIRDLDGQRFDDQPLTDRQRIKRGEEWIGGRRYDEPMTDRGQYYERERGRDLSPYRGDDRIYNVLDDGRRTSLDRPINRNRDNEFERQNLRLGRHTSLDRYIQNRRRDPFEGLYQDRGRNGSPERYYDRGRDNGRGRDFDRRRDESPGKYDRPAQPMIDSYADHRKMTDRTTYKDYGEFLQEKIKLDELKKQPVEYPAANLVSKTIFFKELCFLIDFAPFWTVIFLYLKDGL
uniref:Uncharacterized protein n=1 Tax=Magallana gigas TaxID=29159 RepID=A0A8W8KGH5_MAGGI